MANVYNNIIFTLEIEVCIIEFSAGQKARLKRKIEVAYSAYEYVVKP